eukprot:scaffold193170_cov30-Prasinocladus_malaysianus.AAC.1
MSESIYTIGRRRYLLFSPHHNRADTMRMLSLSAMQPEHDRQHYFLAKDEGDNLRGNNEQLNINDCGIVIM